MALEWKKGLVIFGPNFRTPATVRAAAIRQEIAPQTISTKDVYQSKHMVAAQIGEARRARRRPAKQILIQLTILRSTVWIIIINTHAKPLKSEHWKGPVEPIRIEWVKYYIARQSGRGQLISKPNFELIIWTKKRTKIFFYFCHEDILLQNSTFMGSSPTQGDIFFSKIWS